MLYHILLYDLMHITLYRIILCFYVLRDVILCYVNFLYPILSDRTLYYIMLCCVALSYLILSYMSFHGSMICAFTIFCFVGSTVFSAGTARQNPWV